MVRTVRLHHHHTLRYRMNQYETSWVEISNKQGVVVCVTFDHDHYQQAERLVKLIIAFGEVTRRKAA